MLSLKIERLTELTSDELVRVAGAADAATLNIECVAIRTVRGCTTAIICPVPDA